MKTTANRAIAFVACAFATAWGAAALVAHELAPQATLNLWPLAVGGVGIVLAHRATPRRKMLFVGLVCAAFVLEMLGEALDVPAALHGSLRIALLLATLAALIHRPIDSIGATVGPSPLRSLLIGSTVGALPTAGPWLGVFLTRPEAVVLNESWRYAGEPTAIAILALTGAFAILFVNTIVGEEAGWRGFLVSELKGSTTRRRIAWGTAVLFALWHLPFDILISQMDAANLVINQFSRYLMGLVYIYLFLGAGCTLLTVTAAHTVHNFVLYQLIGPKAVFAPAIEGMEGLAVAGGYLLIAIVLTLILGRWSVAAQRGVDEEVRQ